MFKKIRNFFSMAIAVPPYDKDSFSLKDFIFAFGFVSSLCHLSSLFAKNKVQYILETTDEHLEMVEYLSEKFNMTFDETINFLIFKECHFVRAKEKKRSIADRSERDLSIKSHGERVD